MKRTDNIRQYLKNKHRGGENNEKGGLYEDFYAVYQIVSCIARYKSCLDGVEFQTQLEDTFVDDLLIVHPKQNVYHQLKNTQALGWGNVGYMGNIAFDFYCQIDDCKERNEDFALKLVYSLTDSNIGRKMPKAIEKHTTVEYFAYENDLNSLVLISHPLKEALMRISPYGAKTPADELANIATVFLGIWRALGSKKRVSLQEIVSLAESVKRVNLNIYPDSEMSVECKEVLRTVEGLDYYITGRMLYWTMGRMNGCSPWSVELEKEILRIRPIDKWKLLELLS